jgi:hypothetical protein
MGINTNKEWIMLDKLREFSSTPLGKLVQEPKKFSLYELTRIIGHNNGYTNRFLKSMISYGVLIPDGKLYYVDRKAIKKLKKESYPFESIGIDFNLLD